MPTYHYNESHIYFEDLGSGIPIIFIHPPAMGRKVFRYQEKLAQQFRVIFPDLSGHGDTIGNVENISIQRYADEVKSLLDHLEIEKAVILGYSSGGSVAQEFALNYPDRTLGLILSGGFPEVQSIGFKYEHLAGMYLVKHFPALLSRVIASSHTDDTQFRNEIIRHMEKADREVWFKFYNLSLHYSCVDRLSKLSQPLLLIYGSRDFINQHMRAYKRYTNFQAAIVQKVSHQVPTKKWKVFNQIITGFVHENFPQLTH